MVTGQACIVRMHRFINVQLTAIKGRLNANKGLGEPVNVIEE